MSREVLQTLGLRLSPAWAGLVVVLGLTVTPLEAQDELTQAWIYRKAAGPGERLSPTEGYFTPFFFFPASKTADIQADSNRPTAELGEKEKEDDTCIAFSFQLRGGEDWAGAGLIPGDTLDGPVPPLDLTRHLTVGFGRPVQLSFRARTDDRQTVRVRFESCGLSAGRKRDGIKFPQTPQPQVSVLSDNWKTISIDLTKKSPGLTSLVCPLKVIARANENPGKEEVTVYVDDIRFKIVAPDKKND